LTDLTPLRLGFDDTNISVNVEDALGLDTDMVLLRAEGIARLGDSRRHRLDFGYFDLSRSGTKTLGKDITMGIRYIPSVQRWIQNLI